ncbi:MAG: polysaccharide ABC transporter ATP-binding protein [Actinobacteria bacterium]|nr:polysaccharide ABC transporter ATP-binding protein [Actinomycetota bacterium]
MENIVIDVQNLGKKYIISHQGVQDSYTALRDVISEGAKKLIKKRIPLPKREEFWALRKVSFTINQGERVGIIGRNGAGKTTILKLLSRVTEPSEGIIKIKGRVSSLLEVGTGFHPELTGRENIFFYGAILGMARTEIKRKFNDIVDFAEVEKFIDTPVKRYSSGMYVRLAFAVAAHLDSEILIVDEVLAVGDSQFQKKCLGKMDDVSSKEGRTVLFVSHNMAIIKGLCNKGILLEKGQLKCTGEIDKVITRYEFNTTTESAFWENKKNITNTKYFDILSVSVLDSDSRLKNNFFNSEKIKIKIDFLVNEPHSQMKIQLYFLKFGEIAFTFPIFIYQKYKINKGKYSIICEIPPFLLGMGNYYINIDATLHNILGVDGYEYIIGFEVRMDKVEGMPYIENIQGYFFPILNWYLE